MRRTSCSSPIVVIEDAKSFAKACKHTMVQGHDASGRTSDIFHAFADRNSLRTGKLNWKNKKSKNANEISMIVVDIA
jgi:hypothetical protein